MTCPHCQKELTADYNSPWCPFCGKDLVATAKPAGDRPPAERVPVRFRWKLFLCALLGPAALTLVSAAVMRLALSHPQNEGLSPLLALSGSVIGGIVCGVLLGTRNDHSFIRAILTLIISGVMIIVCIILCFFGCGIGGYQFRID